MISLQGQTALVTGGSRGIGSAVCSMLASSGAFVVVNYRSSEASAQDVMAGIKDLGGDGKIARFDVCSGDEVDRATAEIIQDRGKIDILVNNAGISRDGLIGRMKDQDWNDVLSTNLSGVFHICRSVSKSMIRNRKGRIINISSTAGEAGNPGQVNYSAAKAGLIGFTKALARELAPRNILVNSVSPGIISGGLSDQLTEDQLEAIRAHVPLRRTGTSDDVAAAVLFLSSGMADYITGQVIRVNGGLYM
ncbi:MAG: 3-oxoacyl-[acyl-carrier-protein] reductase [Desulfomonile tiedjei]|uniref:3-oxoacyl-[acyl-carrier-protein] reductase n=1 Tax=Desulfomonile tiedjei TaxID=2358 RepID=A0A9D6V414_9BACT|nr:3-oxoacyl-[acyl-carrier-protein] reductase [Desulfomonile tiedjei]